MSRRALSLKNAPRRMPVISLMTIWLFADRLDPSPLAWGFIYSFMGLWALIGLIDVFTATDVELP